MGVVRPTERAVSCEREKQDHLIMDVTGSLYESIISMVLCTNYFRFRSVLFRSGFYSFPLTAAGKLTDEMKDCIWHFFFKDMVTSINIYQLMQSHQQLTIKDIEEILCEAVI